MMVVIMKIPTVRNFKDFSVRSYKRRIKASLMVTLIRLKLNPDTRQFKRQRIRPGPKR